MSLILEHTEFEGAADGLSNTSRQIEIHVKAQEYKQA